MSAYTKKQQIIDDIEAKIASGEWPPGTKLPSATQLCDQYDVSRMTVRSAIDYLKAVRTLEGAPGSGVYVRRP
jgi:DNA-binding GntR family transcriptional regulator